MTFDFFLSYRRADQAIAQKLIAALERRGVKVWWDQMIGAGVDWRDAIVDNLIDSHVLVILFSEECNDSKQLKKELALADDMNKDVVPVLIEDTKPKGHFLYELATRNWVQIHPNPESKIEELAEKLMAMTGREKVVEAPTAAAPDEDVAAAKTVQKTVTKRAAAPKRQTPTPPKTSSTKSYRNFLPFRFVDILIVAGIGLIAMFLMGVDPERFMDDILREPLAMMFFTICAFAIYGAFVFPVRYFLRHLRLGRAVKNYVASAIALYGIGFLPILAIVVREGRWHIDIWGILITAALASAVLGIVAFIIYGILHFARSMRAFQSHVEEI